jgi:hypothetical protein
MFPVSILVATYTYPYPTGTGRPWTRTGPRYDRSWMCCTGTNATVDNGNANVNPQTRYRLFDGDGDTYKTAKILHMGRPKLTGGEINSTINRHRERSYDRTANGIPHGCATFNSTLRHVALRVEQMTNEIRKVARKHYATQQRTNAYCTLKHTLKQEEPRS